MDKLLPLVRDVISFDMKHSAEIQACDLLMEIDKLDLLTQHMEDSNYPRVCLYLIGYVFSRNRKKNFLLGTLLPTLALKNKSFSAFHNFFSST